MSSKKQSSPKTIWDPPPAYTSAEPDVQIIRVERDDNDDATVCCGLEIRKVPKPKLTDKERLQIVRRADRQIFCSWFLLLCAVFGILIWVCIVYFTPYFEAQTACEAKAERCEAKNDRFRSLSYINCLNCPACNLGCALTCDPAICMYQTSIKNCTQECVVLQEYHDLKLFMEDPKNDCPGVLGDCFGASKNQNWAAVGMGFSFIAILWMCINMCNSHFEADAQNRHENGDYFICFNRGADKRTPFPSGGCLCWTCYRDE